MVDATQATESEFITADVVNNLQKKQLVVIDAGNYEKTEWGDRLTVGVELEKGRQKKWRPNKDSAKNLASAYGYDTKSWLGKVILLRVEKVRGKDSVIATATHDKAVEEESVSA